VSGEINSVSRYVSHTIWQAIVFLTMLGGIVTTAPAQTSFFGAPKASYDESDYEPSEEESIEISA